MRKDPIGHPSQRTAFVVPLSCRSSANIIQKYASHLTLHASASN
jgi:hypothetical protein